MINQSKVMGNPIIPTASHIPTDYSIYKSIVGGDLTIYDANGNLVFKVRDGRSFCSVHRRRRGMTVSDPDGTPLISLALNDSGWQAYSGERKELIFTVQKVYYSALNTELEVTLSGCNVGEPMPTFRLKGSPFKRFCTIYRLNSIVAQTNLMYKLRKVIYSRNKFRLTVYPGMDPALTLAMLIVFLSGY